MTEAQTVGQILASLREQKGLSEADVELNLMLGPGWVNVWETGTAEPTLPMLNSLVTLYGATLSQFFGMIEAAGPEADRHLSWEFDATGTTIIFPMGPHRARVELPGVTQEQFIAVHDALRNSFAAERVSLAVVTSFLEAMATWPGTVNPSDVWYFYMAHAYQDPYNHPGADAGKDWPQSWKRTGGWALEEIVARHYNPFLEQHNVSLEVLSTSNARKAALLAPLSLPPTAVQKLDVLAIGRIDDQEVCFGGLHVKASLAERRNDDEALSGHLISRGLLSPLVTMDCKASPGVAPVNRGEFGALSTEDVEAINKRREIEENRVFDAVFSFNQRTIPTAPNQAAAARIHVVDFQSPHDRLGLHVVNAWRSRTGQSAIT